MQCSIAVSILSPHKDTDQWIIQLKQDNHSHRFYIFYIFCSHLDLQPLPEDVHYSYQPGADPPQQHYSGPGLKHTLSQHRCTGKSQKMGPAVWESPLEQALTMSSLCNT